MEGVLQRVGANAIQRSCLVDNNYNKSWRKQKEGELEKQAWKLPSVDAEYQNATHTLVKRKSIHTSIEVRWELTLDVNSSNVWGIISQAVVRYTSVVAAVCSFHIWYDQLPVIYWKPDPGIVV